jgi:hypothetical protein
MSEATEKQTAVLLKNGFSQADINRMNKSAISEEIGKIFDKGKKTQPQPSNAVLGATEGISEVNHKFQNAYEFGPAGNRHTIRYWDIEDLKKQFKELEEAGYFVETVKV